MAKKLKIKWKNMMVLMAMISSMLEGYFLEEIKYLNAFYVNIRSMDKIYKGCKMPLEIYDVDSLKELLVCALAARLTGCKCLQCASEEISVCFGGNTKCEPLTSATILAPFILTCTKCEYELGTVDFTFDFFGGLISQMEWEKLL